MAKKKPKLAAAESAWISRPHPLGLKSEYREVAWPPPKPGQPTFPPLADTQAMGSTFNG